MSRNTGFRSTPAAPVAKSSEVQCPPTNIEGHMIMTASNAWTAIANASDCGIGSDTRGDMILTEDFRNQYVRESLGNSVTDNGNQIDTDYHNHVLPAMILDVILLCL